MDFQHDRTCNTQITRTMLADDRLLLDRFGAKRAFHQIDLGFMLGLSALSSALAFTRSSFMRSRFRERLSRSAVSESGTAMSREHDAQTSASGALSLAQNGQIVGIFLRVEPAGQNSCCRCGRRYP